MTPQQSTSSGIYDTNKWLQLSMTNNHRKNSKHNNQQWSCWKDAIVLVEKQRWCMVIIQSLSWVVPRSSSIRRSSRTHMWGLVADKPQNITINRGSTNTGPVIKTLADLAASGAGRSGSHGLGRGWYGPLKTAALLESPSTTDTCVHEEEAIRNIPMSPIGFGVYVDLTPDGHNEVDARSCGRSRLLVLSARRRRIINPGQFFTGGPPAARRGDRGEVRIQYRSP